MVEFFVDEVDGASSDLYSVVEGLLLRVQSWKRRQQRRMNIKNALRIGLHEGRREKPHITCQADQLNFMLLQCSDDGKVVFGASATLCFYGQRRPASCARCIEARSIRDVRDDNSDFAIGEAAVIDGIRYREKVGASAGEQDTKPVFAGAVHCLVFVPMGSNIPADTLLSRLRRVESAIDDFTILGWIVLDFGTRNAADHVKLFVCAVEKSLRFLEFVCGDNSDHADAHVEGPQHFILGD